MNTLVQTLNRKIDQAKFDRFGIMVIHILVGSCLAGIAAMTILKANAAIWQLMVCAFTAILANAVTIAMASMRTVVWAFFISVIVNSALILVNVL